MLAETKGGAVPEKLSFFSSPSYTDVLRVEPSGTPGIVDVTPGGLHFDGKKQVKFVSKGGGELAIPYASITSIVYERGGAPLKTVPVKSKWNPKWSPFKSYVKSKHMLTVNYEANGVEKHATMRMEGHNYQNIIGTFEAKTGQIVGRPGTASRAW